MRTDLIRPAIKRIQVLALKDLHLHAHEFGAWMKLQMVSRDDRKKAGPGAEEKK